MHEFAVSNDCLDDPAAIRGVLDREGYIFFRNVIDRDALLHVKQGMMAWFQARGLTTVIDGEPIITGADVASVGDYNPALISTGLWEWFSLRPETRTFYRRVYGEDGIVLPVGSYQYTWPGRADCWDRIHQDGPFNTGIDFLTFWFPLMDIDEDTGGLALVPSPATTGSLHPHLEAGPISPYIPQETFDSSSWHRIDYHVGDALLFAPSTPHCGMPNSSDRLRLSIDIRVQPASARRPILGVVVDANPEHIVIAADSGDLVSLAVDDETALRLPTYVAGRRDPKEFLGVRVIATEHQGRALMVRNPWGSLPWDQ